jgi:hypothetical protein
MQLTCERNPFDLHSTSGCRCAEKRGNTDGLGDTRVLSKANKAVIVNAKRDMLYMAHKGNACGEKSSDVQR